MDALSQIWRCDETLRGCVVGGSLLNLHNGTLCVTSACMKMWFAGAWHGLRPPKRWTGLIFSHLRNLWFPLIAPAAQKTAAAVKLWAHSNQQGQLHFYCGTYLHSEWMQPSANILSDVKLKQWYLWISIWISLKKKRLSERKTLCEMMIKIYAWDIYHPTTSLSYMRHCNL